MDNKTDPRKFSRDKHSRGSWNTAKTGWKNPVIRYFFNRISFKRNEIDRLAGNIKEQGIGLDTGSGNGAYSMWFNGRNRTSKIVAMDWSFNALSLISTGSLGRIFPVCADCRFMPFKSNTFEFLFSIDTLGHIDDTKKVLDESLRVLSPDAPFFFHSETGDYRARWPDSKMIKKLGYDYIAKLDGHINLHASRVLYQEFRSRFLVDYYYSPAGLLGWLTGHPEKYAAGLFRAGMYFAAAASWVFLIVKKVPLLNIILLLFNKLSNETELFLGLSGGGSSFVSGKKAGR